MALVRRSVKKADRRTQLCPPSRRFMPDGSPQSASVSGWIGGKGDSSFPESAPARVSLQGRGTRGGDPRVRRSRSWSVKDPYNEARLRRAGCGSGGSARTRPPSAVKGPSPRGKVTRARRSPGREFRGSGWPIVIRVDRGQGSPQSFPFHPPRRPPPGVEGASLTMDTLSDRVLLRPGGATNRVPGDKVAARGSAPVRCGKCKTPMSVGHPQPVTDASFVQASSKTSAGAGACWNGVGPRGVVPVTCSAAIVRSASAASWRGGSGWWKLNWTTIPGTARGFGTCARSRPARDEGQGAPPRGRPSGGSPAQGQEIMGGFEKAIPRERFAVSPRLVRSRWGAGPRPSWPGGGRARRARSQGVS